MLVGEQSLQRWNLLRRRRIWRGREGLLHGNNLVVGDTHGLGDDLCGDAEANQVTGGFLLGFDLAFGLYCICTHHCLSSTLGTPYLRTRENIALRSLCSLPTLAKRHQNQHTNTKPIHTTTSTIALTSDICFQKKHPHFPHPHIPADFSTLCTHPIPLRYPVTPTTCVPVYLHCMVCVAFFGKGVKG